MTEQQQPDGHSERNTGQDFTAAGGHGAVPTEATPITDSRGAAASSSSVSTRVWERTTRASQPSSSASALSSASRD